MQPSRVRHVSRIQMMTTASVRMIRIGIGNLQFIKKRLERRKQQFLLIASDAVAGVLDVDDSAVPEQARNLFVLLLDVIFGVRFQDQRRRGDLIEQVAG